MTERVHLAVALDGAGWHPAAWREAGARPRDLTSPRYWRDLVGAADEAGVAFVTIEDALSLGERGSDDRRAARAIGCAGASTPCCWPPTWRPLTRRIGLIPTVTTTHPEPFHLATGLQTLDHASRGRAGARIVAGSSAAERANFGRRADGPNGFPASGRVEDDPAWTAAFREAGEVVEAIRALADSWEDDAIIRDLETGRFLDRERVHNIEFAGEFFSITGASIVPRSPQGPPLITALAHQSDPLPLRRRARRRRVHHAGRRRRDRRHPARRSPRPQTRCAPSPSACGCSSICSCSSKTRRMPRTPRGRGSKSATALTTDARVVDRDGGRRRRGDARVRRDRCRRHPAASGPSSRGSGRDHRRSSCRARAQRASCTTTTALPLFASDSACRCARVATPERRSRHDSGSLQAPDPPRRALSRGEQHHGVDRPDCRQPDRLLVVRVLRPQRRARPVRLFLPRRGTAPARASRADPRPRRARADRTRSRSSPRSPPSPSTSGSSARSARPSTSRTNSPASSARSTTSPAAAPAGTP